MGQAWKAAALVFAAAGAMRAGGQTPPRGGHSVAQYNVRWTSLGSSERDSMPLGNGDLAANVWTEQNGDLAVLLAKSDAYTETGKLVKLGRIRVHFSPSPFDGGQPFTQTLDVEQSAIEMRSGANTVRVWIDAHHPALHIEAHTAAASQVESSLETWRTDQALRDATSEKAGMAELGSDDYPIQLHADTIASAPRNAVTWYHFNTESVYPTVLRQQHLESLVAKYPDPLLHRCFGARLSGPAMVARTERGLQSKVPSHDHRIDIAALTLNPAASPAAFLHALDQVSQSANPLSLQDFWTVHVAWWQAFWNRSWIVVSGDEQARRVAQGYALQRYMVAASSRGALPVHFNGGLFTVGHDWPDDRSSDERDHNPDYRAWGDAYWNQNNRLLYWPLVTTGDLDLLRPWFAMYVKALPLATERTRIYYHHAGASLPETMYFWGLPSMSDFGWNNATNEIQSRWQRFHTQGTLEVIAEMLDAYDATGDQAFAKGSLVPFADAIVTYYDQHWKRSADGKLHLFPSQSLETYQLDATNPTPDLAGLLSVLPRLIALPGTVATAGQKARWQRTLRDLPALPQGTTDRGGKTPASGVGDPAGTPVILPAEAYGETRNSENPELYVAFPYHLYGLGKKDLALARQTFAARRFPQNTCWGQDGPQAAALGLTDVARAAVVAEFTNYGDQRFSWFWRPGHDWIPDLDNGGSGMITLQSMLLQTDGRRILLLPAWPKHWTADFRLHAPAQTTVEGHVEDGRLTHVHVWPANRAKDLVIGAPTS